jgi:AraC family transcriptional regulator
MLAPSASVSSATVAFSPSGLVKRQGSSWHWLRAEAVEVANKEPFEYGFSAPYHLLIAAERGEREDGETYVEGLPKSTLHNFSRRLTLVPAGHAFRGWQRPRVATKVVYFYIDPRGPLLYPELRLGETELAPRLFFFDADLWETAAKLKAQIADDGDAGYAEALALVLTHELLRANGKQSFQADYTRGGLASWQEKRVAEFMEAHLAEPVRLKELATIARLSPFHFARAFKRSFGMPPHRYHLQRRIARARSLLAEPAQSVTSVAFQVGFADLSSFTAAFRRVTGASPSQYRRSLA